jgi:RNA:NAD 2'-phosphotransferase (TPT1/KptA family)
MEKASKAPQRLDKVGREMSRILRHDPPAGAMDKHGWVPVPTLIAHMKSKPTYNEILQAVAADNKVEDVYLL